MLGLSGTAVVKAIKAERPVSTLSGSSFGPAEFTPVTRCGRSRSLTEGPLRSGKLATLETQSGIPRQWFDLSNLP
jgi:hypothetical protein